MPRLLHAAALLLAVLLPLSAQSAARTKPSAPGEPAPEGMLPDTATPLHYELHFKVDPAKPRFSAEATLTVQLNAATDHVWLHGKALAVSRVTLTDASGQKLPVRYRQVAKDGTARVDFGRQLPSQTVELRFAYSAAFNTALEGLYKVQRGGDSYAMTQMEAVSARWAFPSFDEPRFKTPFALSLTLPTTLTGVANTRQTGEERSTNGRLKTLHFATTEKLPTYLVAFAVGPWDMSETRFVPPSRWRRTPLPLRVLGPKGSKASVAGYDYVLKTTPAIVLAMEDYFGIAYPFDKLDLLAAPDFAAGAMENAGLITYLDSLLVLDEKASLKARQDYIAVNAHELAHQWFGNYVTPRWWDDIWLNEAFASWMATKITVQLYPEWREDLFQLADTQRVMAQDSLVSARRIREPVRNVGDIGAAFDGITYVKGAAVLSTLESWIGAEKFQQGVRNHMALHARGVATADDLLAALEEASGRGAVVSAAARSLIDQPGLPLVEVTPACENGQGRLQLKQSRYLPLGSTGVAAGAEWKLPVCLRLGRETGSERYCTLLDKPEATLDIGGCPRWVMPNADAAGYYRFTLPKVDFQTLGAALPQLNPAEQTAYGDAVRASFEQGKASVDELLQALAATASSPLPGVLTGLWPSLEFLRTELLDASGRELMQARLGALYAPALARLGSEPRAGESEDDAALRTELFKTLGADWGVPAFVAPLRAKGEALLAASGPSGALKLDSLPSDLSAAVLSVLLQEQGAKLLPRVLAELASNRNPQQRAALLNALGHISDPALIPQVRALALGKQLQFREMRSLLYTHAAQPPNGDSYYAWFTANLGNFRSRLADENTSNLLRQAAVPLCSEADGRAFANTFKPLLPGITGGARAFAQQAETIRLCAALKEANAGWKPKAD